MSYNAKTRKWTPPAEAKEWSSVRSIFAARVNDPATFPGVHKEVVLTLAGEVVEEHYVLDLSPYGQGIWQRLRAGDRVIYPNDASTNMLSIQRGKDFLHFHPDAWEEADDEDCWY